MDSESVDETSSETSGVMVNADDGDTEWVMDGSSVARSNRGDSDR